MLRRTMALTMTLAIAACGGDNGDIQPGDAALNDSLIPVADEAFLPDTTTPAPPETVYTERPAPPPPAAPRPRPSPPPAAAPAPTPAPPPAPARTALASGTAIRTTTIDTVHSRVTRVGDKIRVAVANDVTSSNGRVVIPSGSTITLEVSQIAAAGSKGGAGTLVMVARSVSINGHDHPISGRATDFEYELRGRGIGTGEVAKTAGGAAAGAIIGRVIGGRSGTVIGAVAGGAAGAAVADATQDRDVVLGAGKPVTITLNDEFEA
ncbi:MAG TPA: glycine zipper 2TM domain-containing protein [Gemmatimonadales bacterium]|nr:glycine zipper 2TM domain-containing protein [Gemmatimonadales bacterium]